jgi:lambda repressor-like predicted transcriptional regulator
VCQRPSAYAVLMGGMKERERPFELTPGPWPETPSPDPVAELARAFSLNLTAAIGGNSLRSVSRMTGVGHNTLASILAGKVWPDFSTIARLELGLEVPLWPTAAARKK